MQPDMEVILVEEIERTTNLIRKEPVPLPQPPRLRAVEPANAECLIEFNPDILDQIRVRPDADGVLEQLGKVGADILRTRGATCCVMSATVLAERGGKAGLIVALGFNQADGAYLCLGQRIHLNPLRFDPVEEVSINLCGVLGVPLIERLRQAPMIDAVSRTLMTEALRQRALVVVPESAWMTSRGRVLN